MHKVTELMQPMMRYTLTLLAVMHYPIFMMVMVAVIFHMLIVSQFQIQDLLFMLLPLSVIKDFKLLLMEIQVRIYLLLIITHLVTQVKDL